MAIPEFFTVLPSTFLYGGCRIGVLNPFGVHLVTSEPLVTLTEVTTLCRYVTAAVQIPASVDVGAGFGEPVHVMRTVENFYFRALRMTFV